MKKHTPGPWMAVPDKGSLSDDWYIEDAQGQEIARIITLPEGYEGTTTEGNARLLANALCLKTLNTQLLEALKRAEIAMSHCPINAMDPLFAPLLYARDNALATIKAATDA